MKNNKYTNILARTRTNILALYCNCFIPEFQNKKILQQE